MFKVFSADAATKTHGAVDGTIVDLINPLSLPADTTTSVLKAGVYAGLGYFGRGYKETGKFSL